MPSTPGGAVAILCGPMSDADLLDALRAVAREHLDFHGELGMDTVLVDALRLDSLRLLTLVVEVENHFRVVLEDDDAAGLVTVGDLVALLRKRLVA